ncbi:class I SAM-dependent methyltransferase [Niallia sp. NCCP-28]|uniref:class I SAM-dependent methyltransferase n=1 Tax=Niallia sp. NCCP-28 TaxID=2934712 RepID=UPI00207E9DE1|nr:class I SAM-dependent methyltransferase [Niallia sp. NCCP-28]GKU80903.1 hypothetical protein NCCP28_02990 [Niallia sp. NCCP-28]
MIVTTALRTGGKMIEEASEIAEYLQFPFVERKKKSVDLLQNEYDTDVLVIGKNRYELFMRTQLEPFFFHPNSAVFRIKRIQRKEHDPFIDATNLKLGSTFLDCTFGLGSDSIVASFVVGEQGKVEGCEASQMIAFLVKKGIKMWKTNCFATNLAMQRIHLSHNNALDELKKRKDNSIDCVYFDPMFEEEILSSKGIGPLRNLAFYHDLTDEIIQEALRVAKDRVVLKDHFSSKRFEKFDFSVIKRKSAAFHYGILLKEKVK